MSRWGPLYLDDPPAEEDAGRYWGEVPYRTQRAWRQDIQRRAPQVIDERCRNVITGAPGHIQRQVIRRRWHNAD
eukprot:5376619-Alexandrium_andersonii.AAC.1